MVVALGALLLKLELGDQGATDDKYNTNHRKGRDIPRGLEGSLGAERRRFPNVVAEIIFFLVWHLASLMLCQQQLLIPLVLLVGLLPQDLILVLSHFVSYCNYAS